MPRTRPWSLRREGTDVEALVISHHAIVSPIVAITSPRRQNQTPTLSLIACLASKSELIVREASPMGDINEEYFSLRLAPSQGELKDDSVSFSVIILALILICLVKSALRSLLLRWDHNGRR